MKPDPSKHRPYDTDYLRSLVEGAGLSQRAAARAVGINERTMRYYLSGDNPCPYSVQFALESLQKRHNQG